MDKFTITIRKQPCFLMVIFFVLLSHYCQASLNWTPRLQQAYDSILTLKLASGKELIELERIADPQNRLVDYVDDIADFVTLMITENRNEYKVLQERESVRLKLLEKESVSSPWQRYARAEVLMHWTLLRIKFDKSYLGALFSLRKSYKLLEANIEAYPTFLPNGKTLGMMQVIVGTTPSSYKWMLGLLGFSSTVEEGMKNLTAASDPSSTHTFEANLFRANCLTYVLKQPTEGTAILDSLYRQNPQQVVLGFFLSGALMKNGQSDSAYAILKQLPKSYPYMPMYLISYQMGNILMYRGEYATAIRYFHHFLTYYQGESNVADSWYKMFLAASLLHQPERANGYKSKCLAVENLVTEADKNAQQQLNGNGVIEPTLMTSRLYCDGGYFLKAKQYLSPLSESNYKTQEQKAEYNYRMGRIYAGLRQKDSAAFRYAACLRFSKATPFGFSANAALELGYFNMAKNNWQLAKEYLDMAIAMPKHAYSEGIERKAKAALSEVEKHLTDPK